MYIYIYIIHLCVYMQIAGGDTDGRTDGRTEGRSSCSKIDFR